MPSLRFARSWLAAVLLLACVTPAAAVGAARLETYELAHLEAEAVVAALEPVLGQGARVSRLGNALVVVADDRDHARVKALLRKLDRSPPEYRISVLQGVSRMRARALAAPGAAVYAANEPRPTEVRVSAGRPARIESGQVLRLYESVYAGIFGLGAERVERPVTRGFTVVATPRGRQVELRIAPFRSDPGFPEAGDRQLQEAGSYLVVTPGEWVEIGGGRPAEAPGGRSYDTTPFLEDGGILIRVDEIVAEAS